MPAALSPEQHQQLADNAWHGAVGVFPFRTAMTAERMRMGYVEVEMQPSCALFPAGATVRGHVFHFSEILQVCAPPWMLCLSMLHLWTPPAR